MTSRGGKLLKILGLGCIPGVAPAGPSSNLRPVSKNIPPKKFGKRKHDQNDDDAASLGLPKTGSGEKVSSWLDLQGDDIDNSSLIAEAAAGGSNETANGQPRNNINSPSVLHEEKDTVTTRDKSTDLRNAESFTFSPDGGNNELLSSDNVTPDSQAAVIVVQAEQPSVHVSEAVLNISVPCTPPVNRGCRKRLFDDFDEIEGENGDLILVPLRQSSSFTEKPSDKEQSQDIMRENCVESQSFSQELDLDCPVNESSVPHEPIVCNPPKKKRTRTALPSIEEPSKIRKTNPSKWKASEAKRLSGLGLPHTSLRGKQVAAKEMGGGCSQDCKRKCHFRISDERRQALFSKYWSLGDKGLQWYFIAKLVHRKTPQRRRTVIIEDEEPYRKFSFEYTLSDSSCEPVVVCRQMFLSTFSISNTVVRNALFKNSPDKRGKHTANRKRMSPVLIDSVKSHIKSFPMVPSHYCRSDTNRKYLDEYLNVSKMHRLYMMTRESSDVHAASLRQYRDIFNNYFNLGFFRPKKDLCSLCHEYDSKNADEMSEELAAAYKQHQEDKTYVRALKKSNKESSRLDEGKTTRVITVDLEKVLYTPKSDVGEFYYKRKLSCYNYTVYDCTLREAHLYVWDQTIGRRGSDETSSFSLDFFESLALKGVLVVIVYSDNCTGQNRSQYLFTMYYYAAMKFQITIVHRYLVKGHTQMECDSVHARVEKKSKHKDVYVPNDWYGIMKSAKVKKPAYQVHVVKQSDIFTFRGISASHFKWSKVPLSKVKEIEISASSPGVVKYKLSWTEEQRTAEILSPKVGRPIVWKNFKPKLAYTGRLPLPDKLSNDLKWFLKEGHIPAAHAAFYHGLFEIERRADGSINIENDVPQEVLQDDEDDEPQEVAPHQAVVDRLLHEEYDPALEMADPLLFEEDPDIPDDEEENAETDDDDSCDE